MRRIVLLASGLWLLGACASVPHEPSPEPRTGKGVGSHPAPRVSEDGVRRWPGNVEGVSIRVRVASTREQHYRGLTGVRLAADEGMLFVYAGPKQDRGFWMKGCVMALDIAWLSDDLRVTRIDTLPAPRPDETDGTMPRASSPGPVRYILEMPGGWFERHGLKAGARVRVPTELLVDEGR